MTTVTGVLKDLAGRRARLRLENEQLICYAPPGALTAELRAAVNAHRLALVEIVRREAGDRDGMISRVGRASPLALSHAQERLWFIDQVDPGSGGYNIAGAVRVRMAVDPLDLSRALEQLVQRHEGLRTVFPSEDGAPCPRVLSFIDAPVTMHDLSDTTGETGVDTARHLCATEAARPFDLAVGPLLRATLIRLADNDHVILLNLHHIVADGWSIPVLIEDLAAFLSGSGDSLPPLPIQYADYAAWQRNRWSGPQGSDSPLAYWRNQLEGMPESLDMPTDGGGLSEGSAPGRTIRFGLDGLVSGRLLKLARESDATLFMGVLGIVAVLLHRYSSQDDFCIGTPVANRSHMETARLIGLFVNTLPLRVRLDEGTTYRSLLRQVRETCLEAYARQDTPFEKIVAAVRPHRNLAATPLFRVMVSMQDELPGMGPGIDAFSFPSDVSKFDLSFDFTATGGTIDVALEFNTAMFSQERMDRMARHLACLADVLVSRPDMPIGDHDYLGRDRQRLLAMFNDTDTPLPHGERVHDAIVEMARARPAAVAVRSGRGDVPYSDLLLIAATLALRLKAQGLDGNAIVGLCVDRTPAMVAGMLAIFMSGNVFLPLDPRHPPERLNQVLVDAGAAALVADPRGLAWLGDTAVTVVVDLPDWAVMAKVGDDRLDLMLDRLGRGPSVGDLAYVIFTSGSTGKPKGVAVEHRSLVNHNRFAARYYGIAADDVQLMVSSMGFDLFLEEVLVVLRVGGTLVMAEREEVLTPGGIESLASLHGLTTLNLPTALFHELVGAGCVLPTLRKVIVGGERLDGAKVSAFFDRMPQAELFNTYGPTETTIISTATRLVADDIRDDGDIPIGGPIDNTQVHVLDARRRLVPVGVPGELYIGGAGVARGYLGRDDLTAERFVPDPFSVDGRLYRTGDIVRWRDDGQLAYVGRTDHQVKIRGFRIEPSEIKACVSSHASIAEAMVIAQPEIGGGRFLAFYRSVDGAVMSGADALRDHVRARLPDYMVPAGWVEVATWPLTPNGKVDMRALLSMHVDTGSQDAGTPPATDTERSLAEIWSELLAVPIEAIGRHGQFFELGGHSLLATRLLARIRQRFGAEIGVRTLFANTRLLELAARVDEASADTPRTVSPVKRGTTCPLGAAQERLWFLHQLDPASSAYNIAGAARAHRSMDEARLRLALRRLVERHETLRTIFIATDGDPHQQVLPEADVCLDVVDVSHLPPSAAEEEARRLCLKEASTPFDLAEGPLLRCLLVTLGTDDHVLMLNMHHIVSDGWSIGVLLSELGTLLADPSADLAALPIQYADYAIWQRRWLEEGGGLARQLAYWQGQLAGLPESLELPMDAPRPAERGSAGDSVAFALDAVLVRGLRERAEAQGATLYMALLALVQALLYRYSGQDDLCIGSPIANRRHAETEGLVGMFVNTLPLRTRMDGTAGFDALLAATMRTCLDAYEHQDTPFERIVEAVRPQRNRAISPLFQVMVILQNTAAVTMPDGVEAFGLDHDIAKFDLTIEFEEGPDGLHGTIVYATELYRRARIERMVGHLATLGRHAMAAPGDALKTLDYLPPGERTQVLEDFNATSWPYPREARIHDSIVAQMARTPQAVAVTGEEGSLTYAELDARSATLARYLQARGVGADTIVGLCAERSLAMVVAILGIVRAGAAYLPLDPDYPSERLGYMLADSAAPVVLTQAHLRDGIAPLLGEGVDLRCLDSEWAAIEAGAQDRVLADPATANTLCYVIYTSGSTGQPKGVLNEHRGLVNRLCWMQRAYALSGKDVVLQKTPYSFDVSVWEFFWPLMTGATIAMATPGGHRDVAYLERAIDAHGVTTLHFVPSMLAAFLENGASTHDSVMRVICSGEALGRKSATTYRERFPQSGLYNLYGPTEAAIDVTAHDCATLPSTHVPIGVPIDNLRIYILDGFNRPLPIGIPGELYIAGDGLARGYLNRPDLTAERFVADPFAAGERMYRSGDLARWNEDGTIEYLGRIDTQVKLRGLRIELGEIEACLESHEGVEKAAVVVQGQGTDKRLVAFYRAASEALTESDRLREHAALALPAYMVPTAFVALTDWPTTTSGKTDRRALAAIEIDVARRSERIAPVTEDECRMVAIWADVLGRAEDDIGLGDDFFDLGGHSLLAVRLMARIERTWSCALPLAALFEAPTVGALTRRLGPGMPETGLGVLVAIQGRGSRRPLFAIPGVGGNVLSFRSLADALGNDQLLFGLQAAGLDGRSAPADSVESAARIHVDAIRTIQPEGPYRLLGHSFGGVVAFETARLLQHMGEQVESLALLDAFPRARHATGAASEAETFATLCRHIGHMQGRRIDIPVADLVARPSSQWASLLASFDLDVGERQLGTLLAVHDANRRAYERYAPSPLPLHAPVTVYTAAQEARTDVDHDYGWSQWLAEPARVVDIDAGHFSMLDHPAASVIAMDWRQTGIFHLQEQD
ncbi:MAG: Tyrocidine synthase 3 [Luteibacter sp.]|uniref:amino acid adenylation domain-containing protein n=1 Tax=Luteibacter sp. TaxID=1886636 RepID=UPI0013822498|nr:non-ribosomal peptide synthetase [Luteibacter sp.]KAF1007413.1 MAG: Tyrocidine synthase 3 [Luteibacter sp.]